MTRQSSTRTPLPRLGLALGLATLTACGGGGGDDDGDDTVGFNVQSLSGSVRAPGGTALPGVMVTAAGMTVTTNAMGDFFLPSLGMIPGGSLGVEFDGTTATIAGNFPTLDVQVELEPGQETITLPQIITLPDLAGIDSGIQTVTVDAGTGATVDAIAVTAGAGSDIQLAAPAGTIITIDGITAATDVDINVTPVPPTEVPMPLPEGLLGSSFVTIQPADGDFDNGGTGLDLTLPNTLGLPEGTPVDIWSFDHEDAQWVNRSEETGLQGTVDALGSVLAPGTVTEGGWHTAAIDVDPACATTLEGQVVDLENVGVPGATIVLGTGQFGSTDQDGNFSIPSVPAYDVAALAAADSVCLPAPITYTVSLPPAFGSATSGTLTLDADQVQTGGVTALPDTGIPAGTTGTLLGMLIGELNPGQSIMLVPDSGGTTFMVAPQENGSFVQSGLVPDTYTVSYLFLGAEEPTTAMVAVVANQIATVNLQDVRGLAGETIEVLVLEQSADEFTDPDPISNSLVLLIGTDPGSVGGLLATTNAEGIATFQDVTGPFTVTASSDIALQGSVLRAATTVVGIEPTGSTIGIFVTPQFDFPVFTNDSTLSGTVSNLPDLQGNDFFQVNVAGSNLTGLADGFSTQITVDSTTGEFSQAVPSGIDFDLVLVHRGPDPTSPILSTIFAPNVAGASVGETATQDFDFTAAVAWDQPADVTFANEIVGENVDVSIDVVDATNRIAYMFDDLFLESAMPFTTSFPDLTNPAFDGLSLNLGFDQVEEQGNNSARCNLILDANPASLNIDFGTMPSFNSLSDGDSFTLQEFEGLNIDFNEGAGPFPTGLTTLLFGSDGFSGIPPEGIDFSLWQVLIPGGVTNVTLPATPLPLFGEGQGLISDLSNTRFSTTFDFNEFFGADVGQGLVDLVTNADDCSRGQTIELTLQ